LERLVVRNDYELSLTHNKKSVKLPFDVLGNASLTNDAGNGKLVV
jgi:hypothetical protein